MKYKFVLLIFLIYLLSFSLFSSQWDLTELNGEYTGDSFLMTWNPGAYLDDNNLKLGFEAAYGYTWGEGLNDPFYRAFLGSGGVYLQYDEAFHITMRGGNFASPITFLYSTWTGFETIISYKQENLFLKNQIFLGLVDMPDYNAGLSAFTNQFIGKYIFWQTISHNFAVKIKGDYFQNLNDINDSAYGLEFSLPLVLFDRSAGSIIPEISITPGLGIMGRSSPGSGSASELMNYNSSNIFSLPRSKSGDFINDAGDLFVLVNSSLRYYPFNNRTIPVAEWIFASAFWDVGWIYSPDRDWAFSTTVGAGLGISLFGFFDLGIDVTYNREVGLGYLIGIGFLK